MIGYLGLGANVGDRRAELQAAANALGAHRVAATASSSTYDTDPVGEVQNIFTYGGTELASYPLHIYNRWLQGAFLYFVPLALTSYYPALYVLGKPDPLGLPRILQFLAPLVAALFFAAGLVVWRLGLRHYQSTGS